MTLYVEPSAIVSFSRQLDRATDDALAVKSYVGKYTKDATGGELITIANDSHQHAVTALDGTFTRLTRILEASAPEIAASATYYLQTDRDAAAAVDRALPAALGQCPSLLEYEFNALVCKPAAFADPRRVTGRLTTPAVPDSPPNALGFMDYLSPTSWAMKAFDIILGFDPIAWVQEKFSGDWEALASMGTVLTNAGAGLNDLAFNIHSGSTTLHSVWHGNAGDAAYDYFNDLSTGIGALQAPLAAMGEDYKVMADAVWSAGEMIGGLLKGMIDGAIVAGIAAAAGTATSWSGVGAAAGYGVAAVEVANVLRLWGQATQAYQYAGAAVLAFRSKLSSEMSTLGSIALPALSGGSGYRHAPTHLIATTR